VSLAGAAARVLQDHMFFRIEPERTNAVAGDEMG
jgi:hypothetical protein